MRLRRTDRDGQRTTQLRPTIMSLWRQASADTTPVYSGHFLVVGVNLGPSVIRRGPTSARRLRNQPGPDRQQWRGRSDRPGPASDGRPATTTAAGAIYQRRARSRRRIRFTRLIMSGLTGITCARMSGDRPVGRR